MKKRKVRLDNLDGKKLIGFGSENGTFDFRNSSLLIDIRFNNPSKTIYKFSAEGWTSGQKDFSRIEVRIPDGASQANVLLTSVYGTDNLGEIVVLVDHELSRAA